MLLSLLSLSFPASAATSLLAPDADHPGFRVVTTTTGDTIAGVKADVTSDTGSTSVTLTESDAWLHGAASLAALPASTATVTLTLYDAASATLQTRTGTLAADGTLAFGAGDSTDIEVLAAELFATDAGYDVALDLRGVDTYAVAYGTIVVTEKVTVVSCEKGGACVPVTTIRETEAEIGWEAVGAVWEAELATAPEGIVEVKATAYDARGRKVEKTKAKVGVPWEDGGVGVGAVPTDDDPLTRIGLTYASGFSSWDTPMEVPFITVVSDGWSPTGSAPVDAELELVSGEIVVVPVHSYQRTDLVTAKINHPFENVVISHKRTGASGGVRYRADGSERFAVADLATPACVDGVCVALEDLGDEVEVSVTVYSDDLTTLPDEVELSLSFLDAEGTEVEAESLYPHFQDDVIAMFVAPAELTGDPVGTDVVGKLKLLEAANKKGKQQTLAKGKLYASIGRDGDGELALAGLDKDLVSATSAAVSAGAGLTLGDDDGDGFVDAPPVVARETSAGPTVSSKHGDILIDGVPIDYD